MPRQFGLLDASATGPAWKCGCGQRHRPGSPCPPVGVWLVLAMCRDCAPRSGAYCGRHDISASKTLRAVSPWSG